MEWSPTSLYLIPSHFPNIQKLWYSSLIADRFSAEPKIQDGLYKTKSGWVARELMEFKDDRDGNDPAPDRFITDDFPEEMRFSYTYRKQYGRLRFR